MGTRQAVVVIHGMGEQKPGDTLNQMSEAIVPPRTDSVPRFISRPDKITDGYDARRLIAIADGDRLQTDIYEYHWAHLMSGNEFRQVVPLVKWLMLRKPTHVPSRLMAFFLAFWLLVALAIGLLVFAFRSGSVEEWTLAGVLTVLGLGGVYVAVAGQILKLAMNSATKSFVDVARYLDSAPANQGVRDAIRRGAVELLAGLHDSGKYSRIVVVGHSLGSFIGYDAITYLWGRVNREHNRESGFREAVLDAYERKANSVTASSVEDYQAAQRKLWLERRRSGNPWLVTDFVSVGSPMSYATILLARNEDALEKRKRSSEVPTNPPYPEIRPDTDSSRLVVHYDDEVTGTPVIHHGAPFAVVRWTNIWFSNDLFAGPIAPALGVGVRDREAERMGSMQKHVPLFSHAKYFERHEGALLDDRSGAAALLEEGGSVDLIRQAVDLTAGSWVPDAQSCPQPNA